MGKTTVETMEEPADPKNKQLIIFAIEFDTKRSLGPNCDKLANLLCKTTMALTNYRWKVRKPKLLMGCWN